MVFYLRNTDSRMFLNPENVFDVCVKERKLKNKTAYTNPNSKPKKKQTNNSNRQLEKKEQEKKDVQN